MVEVVILDDERKNAVALHLMHIIIVTVVIKCRHECSVVGQFSPKLTASRISISMRTIEADDLSRPDSEVHFRVKAHFRRFKQQAVTSKIQQTAMQAGQRWTVRLLLICQLNVNCLSLPSTSTCTFLLQSSERFV
ncbi:hypothetical protein Tsp_11453 [Trichinella spiralis]|uniref:hypothetical protein n=1 Tax=Trichinella spiralis TaxID=6334 RepID=UPI0001EFDD92|nr:hypothetical protein Tsp_11453 [Trichinella spiralis]